MSDKPQAKNRNINRSKFPLVGVGIDPAIWAQIKEIAKDLGIPLNQAVTLALKDFIDSKTF
jgi:antitoxin component of RelBE/YafQ-DinJ toxin-antitoxin module